jgi:NitT/TauT family transport system ATP-binding protein
MSFVLEGVAKEYGSGANSTVALADVTLSARGAEFLSIVGPSGCGKTTFLRCIAGLTDLTGGELLVGGKSVAGPPDGVAMVFQHFGLLPWKTVYDNAAFGLAMANAPAAHIRERVGHYLDLVGLGGFERHYPYQLSGGMQQRVGLVRALAIDPAILLMDEPFAALDAMTKAALQDELLQVRDQTGSSIVFVTHDIEEAVYLGDRVAVIRGAPGRIERTVAVDLPKPRDQVATRQLPKFLELRYLLHQAIGQSAHA